MVSPSFKVKLFLCVVAAFACSHAQASEAVYQGKPESYWINALVGEAGMRQVRGLGSSNEIVVLLKAVEKQEGTNAALIRKNAALVLHEVANSEVLIKVLKNNSDPVVRQYVIDGLISKMDKAVTLALIEALKDKDPQVRATAAIGLSATAREQIPEVVPALIKCLQDKDPQVRMFVGGALSAQTNGAEAATAEFKRAAKNPDPDINRAATEALKEPYPEAALKKFIDAANASNMAQRTNRSKRN